MTAGIVNGKADVTFEEPIMNAEVKNRSSVEITDSCNCFKFCLPCFGKKVVKKDPRSETAAKTMELMQATIPSQPTISTPRHSSTSMVRSPKMETLSHPHISVDVHIETGDQ
jgi:hypothetical protein